MLAHKNLLASRFVAFSERINNTNRSSICLLYNLFKNDQRAVLSKNCNMLVNNLFKNLSNKILRFQNLPDVQNWKIPLVYELQDLRSNNVSVSYVLTNK